jgi:hypothetical protein
MKPRHILTIRHLLYDTKSLKTRIGDNIGKYESRGRLKNKNNYQLVEIFECI